MIAGLLIPPEEGDIRNLLLTLGIHSWRSIKSLRITELRAAYLVEQVQYNIDSDVKPTLQTLVLRISSKHYTRIKTLNEVASTKWIRENTTIPVPRILHWDASTNNPIGYEYTLSEYAAGTSVNLVYDKLDIKLKRSIVRQMTDYVLQMHRHSWSHIGSLSLDENEDIVPGPPFDVHCWQGSDIISHWDNKETFASLNASKICATYSAYLIEHLEKCRYTVQRHPKLANFMEFIPRIDAVIEILQDETTQPEINRTRLVLAHKDMHFANVVIDEGTGKVTAVIDWELAQVMPIQQWNPGNFLWSGIMDDDDSETQKQEMMSMFEEICEELGEASPVTEARPSCELQEEVKDLVDVLRAMTTSIVRGENADKIAEWTALTEELFESIEADDSDDDAEDDFS